LIDLFSGGINNFNPAIVDDFRDLFNAILGGFVNVDHLTPFRRWIYRMLTTSDFTLN
jgi:hypothetical protein